MHSTTARTHMPKTADCKRAQTVPRKLILTSRMRYQKGCRIAAQKLRHGNVNQTADDKNHCRNAAAMFGTISEPTRQFCNAARVQNPRRAFCRNSDAGNASAVPRKPSRANQRFLQRNAHTLAPTAGRPLGPTREIIAGKLSRCASRETIQ